MANLGGEKSSVQNPLVKYAQEVGWNYLSQEEALTLRSNTASIIFKPTLTSQLKKLNPDFMDQKIADDLISKIERVKPNIEGNFLVWEYMKGLKTAYVEDLKQEKDVKFIDTVNIENNVFQVTDEFSFTNGVKTIRQDVVFLINGIPLLFIETKSAKKQDGIADALEQIKRYHRECPELLAVNQLYALTHIIHFYYSSSWSLSEKGLFNWKEETKGNFETLVKSFLDKERIVRLITDFILFTRKDDELFKVVLRPHQIRAVDKIIDRAKDKTKKRALIWHTQGSGKTYSMIVAAKKIIENPIFKKPTVLMLIDRNELQTQLSGVISSAGIEQVEISKSKADLQKLFKNDTRGLIVSMIHKFDDIPANINTRDNIFVLVDEAHRTTSGTLGNYLMGALPNASFIGFTGTPIDKTQYGKGTFLVFGKDDEPHGYLDKYGIVESIADGTTVPLHYALAPNNLLVDKDTLDKEFFALAETEGVSDIEELNKVLQKAVTLKNMLKNEERIKKVVQYTVNHYKDYVEPLGYKAFLVGVDREACAMFKEEIDKLLPTEYSEVVYSPSHNDSEYLAQYHISDDKEKRIRKDFRNPDKMPKILIVTEKLLTGYDAPVLYAMYLDKPMREHVLLQTIARVNRPYEDNNGRRKSSGLVIDFVGIFDNLEKALKFDSQDIAGVVRDIELLKQSFADFIQIAKSEYLKIIEGKTKDKAYEAVLEYFFDEEKRQKFYLFFKEVSEIYDIISPDVFLREYIDDYETLASMYNSLRENYDNKSPLNREFSKKTAKLVQENTTSGKIQSSLEIYELDENLLKKIEESKASDTEKVFNLTRIIDNLVDKESDKSPFLIPIGEKAMEIAERFKKRQQNTQETLDELKELIDEINNARKEQADEKMPDDVFAVYITLKGCGIKTAKESAYQMEQVLKIYSHIRISEEHEREIRNALYKFILKSDGFGDDIPLCKSIVDKVVLVLKGKQ